jgi:hypothetical protein
LVLARRLFCSPPLFPSSAVCFRPLHEYVGEVHIKQVYEIAKIKQKDAHMQHIPLESICRSILGSAHSMGVRVIAENSTTTDYTAARARMAELKKSKVAAGAKGKKKK